MNSGRDKADAWIKEILELATEMYREYIWEALHTEI
jgi:hypothetical protein